MNALERLVQTKAFKKLLSRLYGIGASVVVIGALFKIEHWQGASIMLSLGLFTEAIIFFFFAFDSEPDIDQPDHATDQSSEGLRNRDVAIYEQTEVVPTGGSALALARLDDMLQRADISPDLLNQLGVGLRKLGETAGNLQAVENVTEASQHYVNTIKTADASLDKLAKTYEDTISHVTSKTVFKYKGIANSMSVIETESKTYQQQMERLNKLLSSLNTVYVHQKREEDNYLRELVIASLESKKYRRQITELNGHLSHLNKYYGGMVRALGDRQ